MSVIDVIEDWSKRTYQSVGKDHSATRVFTVNFDDSSDPVHEPVLAHTASGIPKYGDWHPNTEMVSVKDIIVTDNGGPHFVQVQVNYTGTSLDMLAEPDVVSYFFFASEEPIDRDINGEAITNSSKEPFDPPVTKTFYDLGIRIQSNEGGFSETDAAARIGSINSRSFRGHAKGTVKCTDYSGTPQWHNGVKYWVVNEEYRVRTEGWKKRLIDVGFRVISGSNILPGGDDAKAIVDSSGERISEPVLLDGSGGVAAAGSTGVFLEFDVEKKNSF